MNQKRKSLNVFVYVAVLVSVILYSASFVFATPVVLPVPLGSAANFSILTYAGISSATKTDVITGDIGVSPTTGTSIGVFCSEITGYKIWQVDSAYGGSGDTSCAVDGVANGNAGKNYVDQAILDANAAITNANGRPIDNTDLTGIAASQCVAGTCDLAGLTLAPGVYTFTGPGNVIITDDVHLLGSSSDVWIFIIPGTLDISSGKSVLLTGAVSANVFWSVAGATTLETTSTFEGTILEAGTPIAMLDGATLHGRALVPTAGAVTTTGVVTVSIPPSVPPVPVLTTITLTPASATLNISFTQQLTATSFDQFGAPIAATILYASNDTSIATVDATGLVTAVAAGTATITASNGSVQNASAITVETAAPILNPVGSKNVTQGTWLNFTVTATSPDGFNLTFAIAGKPATANFTDNLNGTATFSWMPNSSDVGVTHVNFTVTDGIKSASEVVTVNVFQPPTTIPTIPTGISPVVDLGTAGNFVILSKSGISTTGNTSIVGNIGVSPIGYAAITGFTLIPVVPDGSNTFATSVLVTGNVYAADYSPPTPINMGVAIGDMQTAYTDAAGRTNPFATELGAGDISGMTLAPGLYKWGTGVLINAGGSGDPNGVTLDCQGNANAVFIFQIAQTLTVGNGAIVTLSGNCQAQNIFWQVAGQTTLGTTSVFNGNILDQTVIVLNTGATLNGRALAQTAVTLDSNNVSVVAAPSAWRNADFNVTLNATGNATGFNNTQIAYINYSLNNVPGQINGSTGNVLISTNGNNTLTFYAVDILGNVETPNTIHALLDKIPPNITSFTLSATSVNTGDAVIGTCTVTDNLATNITGIITGIDTTTAGSKTATCTATDLAGNIATASAPYTVNTVPSEPSRGGDGNGFLSSGNSQAFSYPQMDEGFHSIDFTKEGVAVTHIELETTGIANNVYMTATQLAGKPTNAPTPAIEKLYGYLQIDHNNLGNSLIGSAKIRFKVAKAWMVSNSVQPDQIALYRFTSQWDLLATTMISQDSAYYYFDASSPGLSYFAIGSINTVTTMIPTAPPEPTTPQTPSPVTPGQDNNAVPPNGGIPITGLATGQGGYYPSAVSIAFVIVVVIGLLIGGFFYFRSRNKPPVHH